MGRETVLYNATWEIGSWPELQHPVRGDMHGLYLTMPGAYQAMGK